MADMEICHPDSLSRKALPSSCRESGQQTLQLLASLRLASAVEYPLLGSLALPRTDFTRGLSHGGGEGRQCGHKGPAIQFPAGQL